MYLFTVLYGTVISRYIGGSRFGELGNMKLYVKFHFHSRRSILHDALNVIMFIPLGILLPMAMKKRPLIMRCLCVMLLGVILPVLIETLQYHMGMAFDLKDVVTNAAGTAIGLAFLAPVTLIEGYFSGGRARQR